MMEYVLLCDCVASVCWCNNLLVLTHVKQVLNPLTSIWRSKR